MEISFKNINSERVKTCFREVAHEYQTLKNIKIRVEKVSVKSSTMQAQPIISLASVFSGLKRYRIKLNAHIRDHKDLKIDDVPSQVLKGWFAHELGHIVDYKRHSNFQMIFFGIKYLWSKKFKKKVEHDADYIAISYGFHEEILATKNFIIEHDLIGDNYKRKILKYYLPKEDVLLCQQDESILEPYLNL
ncbi:hypothetical protein [Psychroflexus sp. ALD_RP9]|uniref:hypothetical protein n=1 Tax=Psychroflexus sp. ALD_RP9 TaxID=2777186 RepID=UPI001A8D3F3F|nr:hypothetical protein [Psychroflexus sp. ALD_RP9]QSS97692.1 hypothetical protein IMZ30_02990 [Psychroflexus sp. ALD_RP9]